MSRLEHASHVAEVVRGIVDGHIAECPELWRRGIPHA